MNGNHATMTPLLEGRQLVRTFGHGEEMIRAVDNVSFSVQPGEIVSIVGESGSGKSTLARLLLRLLEPTSGSILLNGQDITGLRSTRELKGYWQQVQGIFQDSFAAFNQFYTVRRALEKALNVMDTRLPKQERLARIEASLLEVGLDPADILKKWPHQLSGGQLQRVMMARALTVSPMLLIADEPTSMLDASLRVTVLNMLLELRSRHNMGIIFITHDLGQANYVSDRILVMYRGEMVEQGSVETVLANPQHEYTQRLLADVPRLRSRESVEAFDPNS
jgi:peptide/nickel transport system ATP-binding protein